MTLKNIDDAFIATLNKGSIAWLRIAVGIVFFWFGALKVIGQSPVAALVADTYSFFPAHGFLVLLGLWEMLIGIGLLFKLSLRVTLGLLWLQMLGTLVAPLLNPKIFFMHGNPLLLTTEGEFVVKNLVLIAAGLVIGGHEVKKRI